MLYRSITIANILNNSYMEVFR